MKISNTLVEKVAFRLFFTCMFLCAALFLFAIWSQPEPTEVTMRLVVTVFVIGLASFLTWLPMVLYRIAAR